MAMATASTDFHRLTSRSSISLSVAMAIVATDFHRSTLSLSLQQLSDLFVSSILYQDSVLNPLQLSRSTFARSTFARLASHDRRSAIVAARNERRSATMAVSSDRSLNWKVFFFSLLLGSDRSLDWKVVANILSKGTKLREYTKGVENNLWQVELESIQDYIKESDNLLSLHDQIHDCDSILSQMETLLSGFQAEIGSISSDIKVLQEKSMDMGLKLKNLKVAESKLAKFVEDTIAPPRMIDIIVDGEGQKDKNGTRTQLGLSDKKNRRKNVYTPLRHALAPLEFRFESYIMY